MMQNSTNLPRPKRNSITPSSPFYGANKDYSDRQYDSGEERSNIPPSIRRWDSLAKILLGCKDECTAVCLTNDILLYATNRNYHTKFAPKVLEALTKIAKIGKELNDLRKTFDGDDQAAWDEFYSYKKRVDDVLKDMQDPAKDEYRSKTNVKNEKQINFKNRGDEDSLEKKRRKAKESRSQQQDMDDFTKNIKKVAQSILLYYSDTARGIPNSLAFPKELVMALENGKYKAVLGVANDVHAELRIIGEVIKLLKKKEIGENEYTLGTSKKECITCQYIIQSVNEIVGEALGLKFNISEPEGHYGKYKADIPEFLDDTKHKDFLTTELRNKLINNFFNKIQTTSPSALNNDVTWLEEITAYKKSLPSDKKLFEMIMKKTGKTLPSKHQQAFSRSSSPDRLFTHNMFTMPLLEEKSQKQITTENDSPLADNQSLVAKRLLSSISPSVIINMSTATSAIPSESNPGDVLFIKKLIDNLVGSVLNSQANRVQEQAEKTKMGKAL